MISLNVTMEVNGFEWDKGNENKNEKKHNVTRKECEEIFFSKPIMLQDISHSDKELRFFAFGITKDRRLLLVVFTLRNNHIRVISARDQNREEKVWYHNL